MIVDLHIHYPMHVVPEQTSRMSQLARSQSGRRRILDWGRASLIHLVGKIANYRSFESGPRATVPRMHAGGIGVGLSVLYSFWDEMDWTGKGSLTRPDSRYFSRLIRQLEAVEAEVAANHPEEAVIARDPDQMDAAIEAGKTVLIHCVEGAYHLGPDREKIALNVAELAERGVAYLTIGHLFNRGVAEVANAVPFIPEPVWKTLFWQPREPLLEPGKAAIRACLEQKVLIDLSHMSEHAIDATLSMLDRFDPRKQVPIAFTHGGYRFGDQHYMPSARHIEQIAFRGGVIGLIMARHQLEDGLGHGADNLEQSMQRYVFRHIDKIHEITGSHDYTGIGTDFDGFIKPTLAGVEDAGDMAAVERALIERYGAEDAERITSGNALRLLRGHWRS